MMNFFIYIKKWFLLVMLIIAFCLLYYFNLSQYLTLDALKSYQFIVEQWTNLHYQSAISLYLIIFTLLVACGIPCGTVLTLLGGFLFGTMAVLYAIFSTTLGGAILFFAVRTSIGSHIAAKSSGWIKKMECGFQRNAFNYLLMLRLVPIFPCGISNIAAGALNVPLKTYIGATILGIFPATFIYVMIGQGLDKLIADQTPNANILLSNSILLPLLCLAVITVLSIIYRYRKEDKGNKE